MVILAGGTSNLVQDQYTFDPTWGNAGGTTGNLGQPVGVFQFTAGGAAISGTDGLNEFIHDASSNFINFNGVEFKAQVWTGTGVAYAADITTTTSVTFTNIYADGWTHSGATKDTYVVIEGNSGTPFNMGVTLASSVIDGANSGGSGVADSGMAAFAIPVCQNNVIRNVANGCLLNANVLAYANTIGPVNASFDGTQTSACLDAAVMIPGGFSLNYFYSNVVHDCAGITFLTQGAAANNGREFDYLWNNVVYVGSSATTTPPFQFDSISTANNGSQVHAWNNTVVGGASLDCMATVNRGNGNFGTLDLQNNHCISNVGIISLAITGNVFTNNNNLLMSTTTATAQGYTSSESFVYSPSLITNGTVHAGVNLSSLETLNPPGFPVASIANDTTYGGTRLVNIRPSLWDIGAYQFKTLLSGTFFVDNCVTVGDDTNSGTSPATPWLTIGQVNLSGFAPGAVVSCRIGCSWRETLTPPSSGVAGNPITFTAYGAGALPVLDGAFLTSGWISGEPTILSYKASTAADNAYDDGHFLTENSQTLSVSQSNANTYTSGTRFESVALPQGQTIYSATWQGYVYPGDTINTTMYGEAADNSAAFPTAGGTVTCPGSNAQCPNGRAKTSSNVSWVTNNSGSYQSVSVTPIVQEILNRGGWSSGNAMTVLTYSPGPSVPLFGRVFTNVFNTGALLQIVYVTPATNIYAIPFTWTDKYDPTGAVYFDGVKVPQGVASLGALTANNEWYYDYANLAPFLYIYSTTNPNTRVIEIADHDRLYALNCSGRSYVNFSNLSVQRARNGNAWISACANVNLTNMESTLSSSIGVGIELGSSNVTVTGGHIHDNGGLPQGDSDGIGIGGYGAVAETGLNISGVEIDHNANLGIESYAVVGTSGTRNIQFNYIHDNGNCSVDPTRCAGHGVMIDGPGTQTTSVVANLLIGNLGDGLLAVHPSAPITVNAYGNTISANGQNGLDAQVGTWTAKNNLVFNNNVTTGYFEVNVPSTVTSWTSDYNDYWNTGGGNFMQWSGTPATFAGFKTASSGDAHSISTDPLVANAGGRNFSIAANSPLLDTGVSLGSTYQFALLPTSFWPNGVQTGTQNNFNQGWNIGAYLLGVSGQLGGGAAISGGSIH